MTINLNRKDAKKIMTPPLIPSLQDCREGKSRLCRDGEGKKLCVFAFKSFFYNIHNMN
jgi:hypothetical protein